MPSARGDPNRRARSTSSRREVAGPQVLARPMQGARRPRAPGEARGVQVSGALGAVADLQVVLDRALEIAGGQLDVAATQEQEVDRAEIGQLAGQTTRGERGRRVLNSPPPELGLQHPPEAHHVGERV